MSRLSLKTNTTTDDLVVNVGASANDRSGDPLRIAFSKLTESIDRAEANFVELYATASADVAIPTQANNGGKYLTTNGTTLSWGTVATTDTGVIRFNNNVVHTAASQNLVINPGNDSNNRIVIPGPGNGVAFPLSLTNTEGDVSFAAEGNVVIDTLSGDYTWTFGSDGTLNLPSSINAGNAIIQTTSAINIQVNSNAHVWTFGTDGYLTGESLELQGYLKGVDGSTGTTGQVLTRQSNGGVAWADASGGGGAAGALNDLSDVQTTIPLTNGQYLRYNGNNGIWENWTVSLTGETYTPTTSSDWAGTAPTTVQSALDRLAAAIKSLNGTGA